MKTLRSFIQLISPFWFRKQNWFNNLLMIIMIGFALAIIRISVWITNWHKDFYDALAEFNAAAMPNLIQEFIFYMLMIVTCIVCGNWLRKLLVFRWREHLTQQFQHAWLNQHQHYHLQQQQQIDNPDQRIAEDIYLLTDRSIDLFKYFIMNLAKLIAFITILWQLSHTQTLQIAQWQITIHGYLVWVALIYSLLCTAIMHWIGYRLQKINVERQHKEADYRAELLKIREYSEQIALYQGEKQENHKLNQYFQKIKHNWWQLINRELKIEIFSASYLRISLFIPIFATLPMYLAKTITFGEVMQARSAFSNVQDGFGWFMDYYKRLIEWAAVIERLATFQAALQTNQTRPSTIHYQPHTEPQIHIHQLNIYTPQQQRLLENINFQINGKQWVLIEGKSGIGKSTLLKTLANLWQHYTGQIHIHAQSTLFLPQKPYLSHDSLSNILSYPSPAFPKQDLIEALNKVGMPHLINQLEEHTDWQKRLSGGEQQRISIARVLLNKPQILFLDEATNQLDDTAAQQLMHTIKTTLPDSLCLGITHQPQIKSLFHHRINL